MIHSVRVGRPSNYQKAWTPERRAAQARMMKERAAAKNSNNLTRIDGADELTLEQMFDKKKHLAAEIINLDTKITDKLNKLGLEYSGNKSNTE